MKQNRSIVIVFIMSIFMISFILATNPATAQFKHIPNFENFIGTWEYKTDSEHFILKTKTYNYISYSGRTYYLVLGVYKYVKDSVVIYDFLDKFKECMRSDEYVIVMGAWDDLSDNIPQTKLHIGYFEPTNSIYYTKAWHSPLIYIPGNPAQLSWHIEQDECIEEIVEDEETETQTSNTISAPIRDVIILEERPDLNPFTIPVDMILTKVEE